MGKHYLRKTLKYSNSKQPGTFYVKATFQVKGDPMNAARMSVGMWPGTADGYTPPATWTEAYEKAEELIERCLASYPAKDIECVEIRITTFKPGGEGDDLMEKTPLLDLAEECEGMRCGADGTINDTDRAVREQRNKTLTWFATKLRKLANDTESEPEDPEDDE